MVGTRVFGLPCQHRLGAMETDRMRPRQGTPGDDHEPLPGFAFHDVNDD
jgi:hypothetical protein